MRDYTIAKYLRISSEDADLKNSVKMESNSISNQRNLLNSYISRIPEFAGAKVVEFCDDGWSGKNFDRPAVQEVLQQAQQGKIQCIIVKDMSRFGRDYLIVGNYISRVFPFLGVRFIAINDAVDSIRSEDIDSLDTAFKALLYDFYSRDISRKMRSSMRLRAQKGDFLSSHAPYGYVKDPNRKNHLVVDPPAAEIVRRIFQMTLEYRSTVQVASRLNKERVPTPMRYKQAAGCTRTVWHCLDDENFWTDHAVLKIIRDERYLGKVVFGKRYYDVIGSTHSIKVKKEDWIIVSDTHEAIISQEEFDRVQAIIKEIAEHPGSRKSGSPRKIRCGVCGHAMTRIGVKNPYYICQTPRLTDAFLCSTDRIAEQDIFDALLDGLRVQASAAVELERIWEEQHQHEKKDADTIRKALSTLSGTLKQQKQQTKELYEAFALGTISKSAYMTAKAAAIQEQDSTEAQIKQLEASLENMEVDGKLRNQFVTSFQKYTEVQEITGDIMQEVLDEVLVYPENRLEIVWQYRNEFERLLMDLRRDNGRIR